MFRSKKYQSWKAVSQSVKTETGSVNIISADRKRFLNWGVTDQPKIEQTIIGRMKVDGGGIKAKMAMVIQEERLHKNEE